jgi:hypothetical protein
MQTQMQKLLSNMVFGDLRTVKRKGLSWNGRAEPEFQTECITPFRHSLNARLTIRKQHFQSNVRISNHFKTKSKYMAESRSNLNIFFLTEYAQSD